MSDCPDHSRSDSHTGQVLAKLRWLGRWDGINTRMMAAYYLHNQNNQVAWDVLLAAKLHQL